MEVLFAGALASERIPAYIDPACIPDVVLRPSHIDGIRREKQIPRSAVKLWEIVSEVVAERGMTVARWIDSVKKGAMTVWGGPHVEAFRAQVSHGTAGLQIRSYLLACVYCHNCLIDTVIPRSAAILLAGRSLRLGAEDLLFFSVTRAVTTHTLSSLARILRGGSAVPAPPCSSLCPTGNSHSRRSRSRGM